MILQVAADGGIVEHDWNGPLGEKPAGSDAGELQQLRRIDGTATQDHLASGGGELVRPAIDIFHADGAPALQANLAGPGVDLEAQIGAAQCGAQECVGGGPAPAAPNVHLIGADAFGIRAIKILGHRQ